MTVPQNKAIFFPVFNSFAIEPASAKFTPEALCAEISGNFDTTGQTLFASVDSGGGPVSIGSSADLTVNHQQGCRKNLVEAVDPIFTTNDPLPSVTSLLQELANDFGYPPETLDKPWDTVLDGYWVMLEPLAPGSHTIRFGMTPAPDLENQYSQDNTWILNVQAAPVPAPLPVLGAGVAYGFSRRLRRRIKSASGS